MISPTEAENHTKSNEEAVKLLNSTLCGSYSAPRVQEPADWRWARRRRAGRATSWVGGQAAIWACGRAVLCDTADMSAV